MYGVELAMTAPVHVHMVCHDGKQGSSYGLAVILTKVVCRRFNLGKKGTFSFILYIYSFHQ